MIETMGKDLGDQIFHIIDEKRTPKKRTSFIKSVTELPWFSFQGSFCSTLLNFRVAQEGTLRSHEAHEGAEAALVIFPVSSLPRLLTGSLYEPATRGNIMGSYSFPCILESVQCMVPSCSLGPTARDVLNGQSPFLQVLSHLSASEIVSLAS